MNGRIAKKVRRIAAEQAAVSGQDMWAALLMQPFMWRVKMALKLIRGIKKGVGKI